VDLPRVAGPLAVVMLLGTVGVAATGTLFGAMTVRTRARELLLATVLFPLLSPALLASVAATREIFYASMSGQPVDMGEVRDWLVLLGVFDAVAVAGGLAMFGALVED
ncbi:MAG TPA: heme exporter protein CcmB, partial [Polyangiaceae bacterium]|nr:heme exporter protein CcmB [Polyangiaceae bacterium]